MTANGFAAIGLGGVLAGANDKEVLDALDEIVVSKELARINWTRRIAYVAFDAGIADNPQVALGAARLALGLQRAGADVRFVSIPYYHPQDSDPVAGKIWSKHDQGPDDYIARCGVESFRKLVEHAVPADPIARISQAAALPNKTEAVAQPARRASHAGHAPRGRRAAHRPGSRDGQGRWRQQAVRSRGRVHLRRQTPTAGPGVRSGVEAEPPAHRRGRDHGHGLQTP